MYLFVYLFRSANFMHNINIIHRSFFPTALPHRLPFLFLAVPFLALPVSLPCLIPCPAYFLDLRMPTSFCLCLLPMPISTINFCKEFNTFRAGKLCFIFLYDDEFSR